MQSRPSLVHAIIEETTQYRESLTAVYCVMFNIINNVQSIDQTDIQI